MNDTNTARASEVDEIPPRIEAVLRRQREAPLTVEIVLDNFRNWLYEQHGRTHGELLLKRFELQQMEPVVKAVGHLHRAKELVRTYEVLLGEVKVLEAKFGDLDSHQLAAFEQRELDLTSPATLALFETYIAQAEPEMWLIEAGGK